MNEWTYHRGHWIQHRQWPQDEREVLAEDRLRKWDLQRRWQKFKAKLGPVPAKWMDVGPPPTNKLDYISEILVASYRGPIRGMLNEPTPLLMRMRS
jgi:hypothetical protein